MRSQFLQQLIGNDAKVGAGKLGLTAYGDCCIAGAKNERGFPPCR
jgi:hypothetical protein